MNTKQTNPSPTKHTPGPWSVGKLGRIKAEVGKSGLRGEGWNLAEAMADDDMVKSGERDANARLIAAAPELLEACKRMVADLREVRDTGSCSRMRDSQIVDLAAAIAKAEGGAL